MKVRPFQKGDYPRSVITQNIGTPSPTQAHLNLHDTKPFNPPTADQWCFGGPIILSERKFWTLFAQQADNASSVQV